MLTMGKQQKAQIQQLILHIKHLRQFELNMSSPI